MRTHRTAKCNYKDKFCYNSAMGVIKYQQSHGWKLREPLDAPLPILGFVLNVKVTSSKLLRALKK